MGRGKEQADTGLEDDGSWPHGGSLWEKALARERRFRRDAMALLRAVESLNAASRFAQVVEAARTGARELLRGERATIRCLPEANGSGDTTGMTLEAWSLASRKTIWLENAQGIQDLALPPMENGRTPGAAVATPLYHSGRPCGVIAIYFESPRLFTRSDERLLTNFIGSASTALQRTAEIARGDALA